MFNGQRILGELLASIASWGKEGAGVVMWDDWKGGIEGCGKWGSEMGWRGHERGYCVGTGTGSFGKDLGGTEWEEDDFGRLWPGGHEASLNSYGDFLTWPVCIPCQNTIEERFST
jgi:hypothetical protein